LVAVAYSDVQREWFATEGAYIAEVEVEERAQSLVEAIGRLGVPVKPYKGGNNFMSKVLADQPDFVINLVDTVRGQDGLSISVPAALDLLDILYTGTGAEGLTLGNDRALYKQLLEKMGIPTPKYKLIRNPLAKVPEDIPLPLIVKLNESGGSVGIDNKSVKETYEDANKKVEDMIKTYRIPVVVEQFIDGEEITAVIYDDGIKKHVFLAQKVFKEKINGHQFTSLESYDDEDTYQYIKVAPEIEDIIKPLVTKAFTTLKYNDYAKFDIRLSTDNVPYFIDCNPNTAFGPEIGLPLTDVLELHKIKFDHLLASLISKYARQVIKSRKFNIKYEKQITNVHCGPAVIQMLLANLGIQATQDDITRAAGAENTIYEYGTRVDQLATAVKTIAPNTELFYKEHGTMEDIRALLDLGYPVGVEWQGIFDKEKGESDDDDGHYSIIAHISKAKSSVIIVDPYKPIVDQTRIVPINIFEKRWWDYNSVINPKTGKEEEVKDEQLLFIVPRIDEVIPKELGLKSYKIEKTEK